MEPAAYEFSWIVIDPESLLECPILDAFDQWLVDDFSDILTDEDL